MALQSCLQREERKPFTARANKTKQILKIDSTVSCNNGIIGDQYYSTLWSGTAI